MRSFEDQVAALKAAPEVPLDHVWPRGTRINRFRRDPEKGDSILSFTIYADRTEAQLREDIENMDRAAKTARPLRFED